MHRISLISRSASSQKLQLVFLKWIAVDFKVCFVSLTCYSILSFLHPWLMERHLYPEFAVICVHLPLLPEQSKNITIPTLNSVQYVVFIKRCFFFFFYPPIKYCPRSQFYLHLSTALRSKINLADPDVGLCDAVTGMMTDDLRCLCINASQQSSTSPPPQLNLPAAPSQSWET